MSLYRCATEDKLLAVRLAGFKDHNLCFAEVDCELALFTEAGQSGRLVYITCVTLDVPRGGTTGKLLVYSTYIHIYLLELPLPFYLESCANPQPACLTIGMMREVQASKAS